jgi:transposase
MLSLPELVQIHFCMEPTDMRKGFDSLAALVRDHLGYDPLSGHLFVFRSRRGDRVKMLCWDRDGFTLYYRRLEEGTFRFPIATDANVPSVEVSAQELSLLLWGIDPSSVKRQKRYRRHFGEGARRLAETEAYGAILALRWRSASPADRVRLHGHSPTGRAGRISERLSRVYAGRCLQRL